MVNHMLASMTGYAERRGVGAGADWAWDMRSVNGKGLDIRLRLPDGIEGLEPAVRAALAGRIGRGNVTLSLKLLRRADTPAPRINPGALSAALDAVNTVLVAAGERGLDLPRPSAVEILSLRGVLETGTAEEDTAPLLAAILADLVPLIDDFDRARRVEGAALAGVIDAQIARIADLASAARTAAEARRPLMEQGMKDNLARVLAGAAEADPGRIAQELAMLVVKSDVTEELDRLQAHVAAARGLLAEAGAVGRKFDFLMQEFMREANTLCAKSGNGDLTRIGLDLKTVIDQMREQVQNVE